MGKSRKSSKGHSSGFVPDYRRAVETMGESEGLGSSGRVDTEMTASEDSSAPKRKCISLNAESCDTYGVPVQVLSFSKMSHIERKNLEMRLKMELEQVRLLQNKIASLSSNFVLSPFSDIHSCNDGQKRIPIEGFRRSSEMVGSQGKKQLPPGRNRAHTKKNKSGRFEPVKPAVPANTSNAVLMKQCETLLNRLMQHQFGWVFNTPVDVVKLNIPDYFRVIKHPMDLGTIKNKIVSGQYSSPLGFAADIRLTFSNAMTYNPPGNNVHVMAETLSKFFEVRWKSIEKKLPVNIDTITVPSRAGVYTENETDINFLSTKMKKKNPNDTKIKSEPVKQIMTDQEKCNLSTELEALTEFPENIVDFLKEHSFSEGLTDGEEIEIDIYALNDETLFKLRKLLDDFLLEKKQAKAEPCEMELLNESGFSNSSIPPCKGNDQGDEDIDIVGGNDCPISSYPPIEIEKDAANRNNKGISSSSSSSKSGSSMSDSDSGSSSGSESNAAKASASVSATKSDNLILGENLDQKKGDAGVLDIRNQSLNKLDQVELNSQGQPIAGGDGNQEVGESAPSGRQVSPEKLYRAALLRNRFAETILKARKKALEKGEKQDPEKLRIEKEELERQHREDLARIQAEAKAAEEAKRKAEAEEVKRKIEQEREAQRQALLKMEKTVEINENSQFMEDLEMLRATNDEHLPSYNEETSPDHSQNGLGSFKLQGNPLEQLGLYMKADEEEEDDDNGDAEPPLSFPEPANDIEFGEID
ncbi:hypothetical protein SLA2020_047240 [Shorea laevis]